jgi:hypothetical protein
MATAVSAVCLLLVVVLLVVASLAAATAVDGRAAADRAADELAIHRLLANYAHAIDTKDWALYRDCFTEDAVIDYTAAGGIKGPRDVVAVWMARVFSVMDSQHLISNVQVDWRGADSADVRNAFNNPCMVWFLPFLQPLFTTVGWHNHQVVRSPADGRWRSRHVDEDVLFNSVQVAVPVLLLCAVLAVRWAWKRATKTAAAQALPAAKPKGA